MNTCNNDSKISVFTTLVHEDCFMADISIRLLNEQTDTDCFVTCHTRLNRRDIQYCYENLYDLQCGKIKSFGFMSADGVLKLLVRVMSEGVEFDFDISPLSQKCRCVLSVASNSALVEEMAERLYGALFETEINKGYSDRQTENVVQHISFSVDEISGCNKITLVLPEIRIVRRFDIAKKDALQIASEILLLLEKKTLYSSINDDHLSLSITEFDSMYLLSGEIGDFSFPNYNRIEINDGIEIGKDAIMQLYDSLLAIEG